ncbi:MAG: hypothetical protein V1743_00920 [Nanoarchaeota archaeon]
MNRREFVKSTICVLAAYVVGQFPASALASDREPEVIAEEYLANLRHEPLDGLEDIVLEYRFETGTRVIGLPINGHAQAVFKPNEAGYHVSAKVLNFGGFGYWIGKRLSSVGLAEVPDITTTFETDLALKDCSFSPLMFKKVDHAKYKEEIQIHADTLRVLPSNKILSYGGEPCPFSMFFTYLLLHPEDVMEGRVINFTEGNAVSTTGVTTVCEAKEIDGIVYDHVMRLEEGELMGMISGDITFLLAEKDQKRIPVKAHVPDFRGYEVFVKLSKAEVHYQQI